MIVELSHGTLLVKQADDLEVLHVVASSPAALDAALRDRGWGWLGGDGDALLDVRALRSSALASGVPDERDWERRWTAMIAYATSKRWMSRDGKAVKAHVETLDG